MKTFDEKDLITWSNRHTVKVGDKGYFGDSISDLNNNIKMGRDYKLENISDYYAQCFAESVFRYSFFLPKDAVKERKTYRACKNVQELYGLVFNCKRKTKDSFCINGLIGAVIHFKQKGFDTTLYKCITGIAVYINGDIAVDIGGCSFELDELFKRYKIEINGEWLPFGVEE